MNNKKIKKAVKKRIKQIKKQAAAIPGADDKEAIHQFRTGYKKLRALIRLINLQTGEKPKIKLPNPLKKVYKQAGIVREWQLYYDQIASFFPKDDSYLQAVGEKIKEEKKALLPILDDIDISKIKKKLKKELPARLDHDTLEQFIKEKIDAGATLQQAQMTDEDLHTMRKYFKDINYNLKIYKDDITDYLSLKNKKNIDLFNKLPEDLSTHQDYATHLQLLNQPPTHLSIAEKRILRNINRKWREQKSTLKESILQQGDALFNTLSAKG